MHGPVIRSAVRRMVTDPSPPDYPKGLFRHHGTDRTLDKTFEAGSRPFLFSDDLWVPGHPSTDDWPRALAGKIYQWDPTPSITKYEQLSKGREARVTFMAEAATEDNIGPVLDDA